MRPAPAGLAALLLAALLTGCSGDFEIDAPELSQADREACTALREALPETLLGQSRRPVTPEDAPGAAWGDPAVTLTCGVEVPEGYEPGAECVGVREVGWFVPVEQQEDPTGRVVATVLTHRPHVELVIPGELRDAGVDGALTELAAPIRDTLQQGEPCL